jgi:hypothetical protein
VVGAVTVKESVTLCPAGTGAGSSTRCRPHVAFPRGLSDPSRYALQVGPTGFQSSVPVFVIVMLTGYVPPGSILVGTLWETNSTSRGALTTTTTSGLTSPNQVTHSCSMCHWKW